MPLQFRMVSYDFPTPLLLFTTDTEPTGVNSLKEDAQVDRLNEDNNSECWKQDSDSGEIPPEGEPTSLPALTIIAYLLPVYNTPWEYILKLVGPSPVG